MKVIHSIQQKMLILFLCVVLIGAIIWTIGAYIFSGNFLIKRSHNDAKTAEEIVCQAFRQYDLDDIFSDEDGEAYRATREMLRSVCVGFRMQYLYAYQIDETANTRVYLMTVAAEDETDAVVQKEIEAGTVRSADESPLHKQELAARTGETSDAVWLVNNEYGNVITWVFPLYEQGEVRALIGMDFRVSDLQREMFRDTGIVLIPVVILLLLIIIVELFFVRRDITLPLRKISARMNTFVEDQGQEFSPLAISSGDEMQEIADSFEKMRLDIANYLRNIRTLSDEQAQTAALEKVTRHIQSGILPKTFSLTGSGFCAVAFAESAKSVGGDFYDCFLREDGNVCAVIGDVSGKGIAAALFMTMVKTMLRERLRTGCGAADALNYVNDEVCAVNKAGMFATVFVAVLRTDTGELTFANAGHTRPVLFAEGAGSASRPANGDAGSMCGERLSVEPHFLQPETGIAIGLFEDAGIVDEQLTLQSGQGIFLYTDGAVEAVSRDDEFFGDERLLAVVGNAASNMENVARADISVAKVVVDAVVGAVKEFQTGREPFDDLTALALFYKKEQTSAARTDSAGERRLEPKLSSLGELKSILREAIPDEAVFKKIYLACEEVFVNIANYAGADYVRVIRSDDATDEELTVTFADNGIPFNPLDAALPEKEFEEFDTGGMGISLIKDIADTLAYEREENENRLTLIFRV